MKEVLEFFQNIVLWNCKPNLQIFQGNNLTQLVVSSFSISIFWVVIKYLTSSTEWGGLIIFQNPRISNWNLIYDFMCIWPLCKTCFFLVHLHNASLLIMHIKQILSNSYLNMEEHLLLHNSSGDITDNP